LAVHVSSHDACDKEDTEKKENKEESNGDERER